MSVVRGKGCPMWTFCKQGVFSYADAALYEQKDKERLSQCRHFVEKVEGVNFMQTP